MGEGAAELAKGLFYLPNLRAEFDWRSSQTHVVARYGFALTHQNYLTSTASQGVTIREGVTIDCARIVDRGQQGMSDETWWFHLYVMFSRATRMRDMLLLRPPSREYLERGPPPRIVKALAKFGAKRACTEQEAIELARELGISVPP